MAPTRAGILPATGLRVTRPGFIEGIRAFKASQGAQNYDVNAMATRQEMRSLSNIISRDLKSGWSTHSRRG